MLIVSTLKQGTPASPLAHAQSTDLGCLAGYAWSDNIGWIDFTCSNVPVRSDGKIEGYAWANPSDDVAGSNNIGWISFNSADTAPCGSAARISGTALSGWAKALSADGNGWDGCISLSGSSPAYGVTVPGGTDSSGGLAGYAWGSDVVGWIDFTPTAYNGVAFTRTVPVAPALSVTLTANPQRVAKGKTTTLTYLVASPPPEGCTLSGNGYSGPVIYPISGVEGTVESNAIDSNTKFTLTCGSASASATVGNLPVYIEI